ncbi:TSUP family permease [Oleiphilus messinensis]|uniref:Probable membrane transporter protein n=1 Tax=Oleiphilus messinensis TaxID=141451 RepID=A0A1Y0ICI1_9GAMM|nr:sulfite exporter TauE/SafE family protein [Oleiphilus messinensis]ARU57839.1 TSUP family permease [Oleiphilus messinensis]
MIVELTLVPDGLSLAAAITLVLAAGITSFITASLGAGGGVALLVVMASVMPPLAIVPVHGIVQLGSNGSRAMMTRRHIDWSVISWFVPGALLGALLASMVLIRLPQDVLLLTIAGFVLYLCWGPGLPKQALERGGVLVAGTVTTFVSMFVGASGPLVAAFIKQVHTDRHRTVATFAMAMSLQHGPKVIVFAVAGFVFTDWLLLMLLMISAGFFGTWAGLQCLNKMSNVSFTRWLNWVLTLLAIRLIWQAFWGA